MARVFIIGGAGQVGQRLSKMLSERGHNVQALNRSPAKEVLLRQLGAEPEAVKYVSRVAHTADDFAVKRAVLV